jgi:hypothetical protein
MLKKNEEKAFLCPACKSTLVPGLAKEYQTLDEHICNPNQESFPERPTWVCSNGACGAYTDCFWVEDGEGPYGNTKAKWIDDNPYPFNSFHRQSHFRISYHSEDRSLRLGRLTIRREVHYRSDEFGNKVGKWVKYTFWTPYLWIPGWKMLWFEIGQLRRAKKRGPEQLVEEILSVFKRAEWPRAEWWRKAARLWIFCVYTQQAKKVLGFKY